MPGVVNIKLDMANDASSLTLTLVENDGPPLAHAVFTAWHLRPLIGQLVQALSHLEGNVSPALTSPSPATEVRIPVPTPLPSWQLAQLDSGEPVIVVESYPRFWTAFSLSMADGAKLGELLTRMTARP